MMAETERQRRKTLQVSVLLWGFATGLVLVVAGIGIGHLRLQPQLQSCRWEARLQEVRVLVWQLRFLEDQEYRNSRKYADPPVHIVRAAARLGYSLRVYEDGGIQALVQDLERKEPKFGISISAMGDYRERLLDERGILREARGNPSRAPTNPSVNFAYGFPP